MATSDQSSTFVHRLEIEISPRIFGDIALKGVCEADTGATCRLWRDDPWRCDQR
ncbi:hypothetical protein ANMWB30_24520 [Arthrobacter sp. MWB30]|nr:hypothetical protein ANMWB30_24520 [Arthrobacter sp. MWB30]